MKLLVSQEEMKSLHGIIRSLNHAAKIIESSRCNIPLNEIINTNRFDFERASMAPGWLKVMRGDEGSEIDEYGVSSFSFEARTPFHPQRFFDTLHTEFPGLYRAKGYFWIATQPNYLAEMSIAGTVREYNPAGVWWAGMSKEQWPEDEESLAYVEQIWDPQFGDRSQKLIFIGKPEILVPLREALENSLMTDEELQKGQEYIDQISDPFNDWSTHFDSMEEQEE